MRHAKRALCALILLAGCGSTPTRAGERPAGAALDPGAMQPMAARYRAVHRGDHRPWMYVAVVHLRREVFEGQPAWRQTYRIEDDGQTPARWQSTTVVHRATMALLAGEDVSGGSFGDSRTRVVARGERLVGDSRSGGAVKAIDIERRGFVVKDVDLLALSVPLRAGHTMRFALLDEAGNRLRPFSLAVERQERVAVPAGQFDAWRIAMRPLDGDGRMTATVHVRGETPRLVLRREYVVNPVTRGAIKRSVGVEELEALPAELRGRR